MISVAYISREILERIFVHSTALNDLLDSNKGSVYENGEYLVEVNERRVEIKRNLQTRKSISQICRGWRRPALKFRFEFLVIDAKNPDTWKHANDTLRKLAVGRYVKRLELDAFDSDVVRLKSAVGILKQCRNARYLSLAFSDDTRRNVQACELILSAMQHIDSSSLEHISCDFGNSFEQATIIPSVSKFLNLRTLSIDSAFGFGNVSLCEIEPLELAYLRSLKIATTKDIFFRCMSEWSLPSFEDLSIFNLKSYKSSRRFFGAHGSKIRTLELIYVEDNSNISSLNEYCPNLQELVVSADGIPYTAEDGISCSLHHDSIKRIGIRDISINSLTIHKTMDVLNRLMRMFTKQRRFPNVQEIRLLDFQRELWENVSWRVCYIELWMAWIGRCETRMIQLQAADGEALSFVKDKIRVNEAEDEYGWLSLCTIEF